MKVAPLISNFLVVFSATALFCPAYCHGGDEAFLSEKFQLASSAPLGAVKVDERSRDALGIKLAVLAAEQLSETMPATGEVQADETQAFDVNPPVSGVVQSVFAKQGDAVRKGDRLAVIFSIEVANNLTQVLNGRTKIAAEIARIHTQYQSDITLQTKEVQLAKSGFEREEELLKEGISAQKNYQVAKNVYEEAQVKLSTLKQRLEQEVALLEKERSVNLTTAKGQLKIMGLDEASVDRAVATGKVTAFLPIVAPVSGFITYRAVTAGERVEPGKKLFSIVNLSPIWVMVDVFQEQIPQVKVGQSVTIETPSKQVLSGHISSVGSVVDASTKTLHVRITTDNTNEILRPGMFVTARIDLSQVARRGFLLPRDAVVSAHNGSYVFVFRDGLYTPALVTTGATKSGKVEVLSGLSEGDQIVVSGGRQLLTRATCAKTSSDEEAIESNTAESATAENHRSHEEAEGGHMSGSARSLITFVAGICSALLAVFAWSLIFKKKASGV